MKKLFILLFLSHVFVSIAQQRPQYSQYYLNQYLINPAAVGTTDDVQIKTAYRKQWIGIEDAPSTAYVTYSGHLGKELGMKKGIHRNQNVTHHGYGLQAVNDKIGAFSTTSFYATYAYHFPISKKASISFGASLGLQQFAFDNSKLDIVNSSSNQISSYSLIKPDGSFGAWLYSGRLYSGFSINQIFNNKLPQGASQSGVNRMHLHYFAVAGYRFSLSDKLDMIPSVLFKAVYPAPVSADMNSKLVYKKKAWAGVSYRPNDAISFVIGGLIVEKIEISYAYDAGISKLSSRSVGSHEVILGLRLHSKSNVYSPSDFW